MSQTHRDGTAGALLWPNPLGAVVQNDVNHRPSYFLPASQDGSRAASWPRPKDRWPSSFRPNSVDPTASPGASPVGSMAFHGARPAASPSLPCRRTFEARRRRGGSPSGALQAPLWNRLHGSTDSRRPSHAPDVHSAGCPSCRQTLPSCRSMRGRHEPSTGDSLLVPLTVPTPY